MKKLLVIIFLYLLVEGDNVIGDGLYVYHRGKHAVDELKTMVDEYYPKIQAIDSVMVRALSDTTAVLQDTGVTMQIPSRPQIMMER